jgi:hypothetical protein
MGEGEDAGETPSRYYCSAADTASNANDDDDAAFDDNNREPSSEADDRIASPPTHKPHHPSDWGRNRLSAGCPAVLRLREREA